MDCRGSTAHAYSSQGGQARSPTGTCSKNDTRDFFVTQDSQPGKLKSLFAAVSAERAPPKWHLVSIRRSLEPTLDTCRARPHVARANDKAQIVAMPAVLVAARAGVTE